MGTTERAQLCRLTSNGRRVCLQARCLDALVGDKDRVRFVVGTASLHQPNHLHVLEYDSTSNDLRLRRLYAHTDQVLDLAPSPSAPELVLTCGKAAGQTADATLWRMDGLQDDDAGANADGATQALASVAALPPTFAPPSRVVWQPTEQSSVASAHSDTVLLWDLRDGAEFAQRGRVDARAGVRALQFDPHHHELATIAAGNRLETWDLRADRAASTIEDAHGDAVLDVDYNPNKPHTVVSGGDDGRLQFWDLRAGTRPLLTLAGHSHWVWTARYNRSHDQLVASSSSDATLALWRVSSISSAPIVELEEQDLMNEAAAGRDVADAKIKSFDEHEDSVYRVAWAGEADAWSVASLSFDGRVVVHQVPSTEKYKILL
ncbi:hypothetical protein P43SY_005534 [Pythium insidiosum]|uniref:EIPR1-like beta-propeller domain-containing protein n=1 Tax=Pythium insidiosum TaxID=114742 RepID=A0AAD5LQG6_PYTIN|nr:hypothetical protein P43SY_005534 [Pythium insidiosum]